MIEFLAPVYVGETDKKAIEEARGPIEWYFKKSLRQPPGAGLPPGYMSNASLKNIANDIAASRVGDAASWIGRAALVKSNTASQFSDGGYAGQKAAQWWISHGGQTPLPRTTGEALQRADDGELIMPATISVQPRPGTKFTDIVGRSFPSSQGRAA